MIITKIVALSIGMCLCANLAYGMEENTTIWMQKRISETTKDILTMEAFIVVATKGVTPSEHDVEINDSIKESIRTILQRYKKQNRALLSGCTLMFFISNDSETNSVLGLLSRRLHDVDTKLTVIENILKQ